MRRPVQKAPKRGWIFEILNNFFSPVRVPQRDPAHKNSTAQLKSPSQTNPRAQLARGLSEQRG